MRAPAHPPAHFTNAFSNGHREMGALESALWTTAQVIGVFATVALIIALIAVPDVALNVLWNATVPLLPASFLIGAAIWRNVCPLATLNMWTNRLGGGRVVTSKALPHVGFLGIVLLVVMVPARRFLFNTNGVVLAVTIALVGIAAVVLGALFDAKAGFCNSICPVLPVERLYGQQPLSRVGNPRCPTCTHCTEKGCIDLAPSKSIAHTFADAGHSRAWLATGYGVFAAAFPGFVFGYYTTQDVALSGAAAGGVYGWVALWMVVSYLVTAATVFIFNIRSGLAVALLAAAAVGIYYWYAAPIMATAFLLPDAGAIAIRAVALILVAFWLWRVTAAEPLPNGV